MPSGSLLPTKKRRAPSVGRPVNVPRGATSTTRGNKEESGGRYSSPSLLQSTGVQGGTAAPRRPSTTRPPRSQPLTTPIATAAPTATTTVQKDKKNNASGGATHNPKATASTPAAQQQQKTDVPPLVPAAETLPLAPHDGDVSYRRNKAHWTPASKLPDIAKLLIDGVSIEAPYTTGLWAQAYDDPALQLSAVPGSYQESAAPLYDNHPLPLADHGPSNEEKLMPLMHLYASKVKSGFYGCRRCGTPICSPQYQVYCPQPGLRGYAVFERLNGKGVELRIRSPPEGLRQRHPSLLRNGYAGISTEDDVVAAASTARLQFIAHCANCDACLGLLVMADIPCSPSPGHSPDKMNDGGELSANDTRTAALLCANSACLLHFFFRTSADLGSAIVEEEDDQNSEKRKGSWGQSRDGRNASSDAAAATPTPSPSVFAFGMRRSSAWMEDPSIDSENSSESVTTDGDVVQPRRLNSDASLDDLLAELVPYGGGRSQRPSRW